MVGLLGVGVAVAIIVGMNVAKSSQGDSGNGAAVLTPTLDLDAPAFPVPAGSTLINAQAEGSGASAYRIAAWTSHATYAATVDFYAGLSNPRWKVDGATTEIAGSTLVSIADSTAVFAHVGVEVDDTDPVKIAVRFVPTTMPPGAVAGSSASPYAFGTLPPNSGGPSLPSWAIPGDGRLVDAAMVGQEVYAIYTVAAAPADVDASYVSALGAAGITVTSHDVGSATVLRVSGGVISGQIILEPDPAGTKVSLDIGPQ